MSREEYKSSTPQYAFILAFFTYPKIKEELKKRVK
jgi:hypothetical protein